MTEPVPVVLVNVLLPAMKSVGFMPSVLATMPATLTWLPAPNNMPFGFKMKTWPLAVRLPKNWLGLLPVMRFSAIAWALGWLNLSASPAAVDSYVQSSAMRWLVWLMVVVLPTVATVPVPPRSVASAALAA